MAEALDEHAGGLAHRRHRGRWSGALVLVWALIPQVALAHEIGTTRVIATVAADRSYAIAISSDASALLGRLELAQRRPITSGTSAAEVQRAFDAVCHEVPRHVAVRFDDVIGDRKSVV